MELTKALQSFLTQAIEESSTCTIEGSFPRNLTDEEKAYLNEQLKPFGYFVGIFPCQTCADYTNGMEPFHLERRDFRYDKSEGSEENG